VPNLSHGEASINIAVIQAALLWLAELAELYHPGQDGHHLPAAITVNRRAQGQRVRWWHPHVQSQLQKLDETFGIRMENAKIPHPPEAAGQHVLEQQPEKLSAR
jgi:hypothetical protein